MTTTIIVTIWKRNYLEEQLNALINQTVKPTNIWILENENFWNPDKIVFEAKKSFESIHLLKSDLNLKFHGRFCLSSMVNTDYTWIIDDDVIPGPNWLSMCFDSSNRYSCITCPTGRIIPPNDFEPELCRSGDYKKYFIGDCFNDERFNYCPTDTFVDYGCNSYFFKTDWIKNFWNIWPYTLASGDDIHLSATSKLLMGIPTVVPKQNSFADSGNQRKTYGFDNVASWRNKDFIAVREKIFKYLIEEKNWKPLLW